MRRFVQLALMIPAMALAIVWTPIFVVFMTAAIVVWLFGHLDRLRDEDDCPMEGDKEMIEVYARLLRVAGPIMLVAMIGYIPAMLCWEELNHP